MKKLLLLLVAVIACSFLLFSGDEPKAYQPKTFYLGGIQINEANHEDWMAMLKKASMNTVEVTVYAKQGNWDSDSLWYDEVDEGVLSEIRAAKKAGIHVFLILRVALDHAFDRNRFMWHGMIMPQGNAALNRWFERYQSFVNKWADIAAEEGVDAFCIGSEMNALSATIPISSMPGLYSYYNNIAAQKSYEGRAFKFKKQLQEEDLWVRGYDNYPNLKMYINDRIQHNYKWGQQVTFANASNRLELMNERRDLCRNNWRKVIQGVRERFDGKVTYAANFDNYMDVDFWDDLDFMGINAYFTLRDGNTQFNNPKLLQKELKRGWKKVFKQIDKFRAAHQWEDKPLVFTELGYVNRKNTTLAPWAGFGYTVVGSGASEQLVIWGREEKDLEERKFAMDALYDVVKEQKINLEGILYWKLTTHEYHLPYEPFALHLTPNAKDSLQTSLAQFSTLVE